MLKPEPLRKCTYKRIHCIQLYYIIYSRENGSLCTQCIVYNMYIPTTKHTTIDIQHVIISLSLHTYYIHICVEYNNKITNR